MYVANVLRQISNSNGLWTGSHIPATDKKSNNYYFCGIIFKVEINLPCVVIAPSINTVYKSYIGCQERILSCTVLFHTVQAPLYAEYPLNTDISFLWTVCFVPGKTKQLYSL